MMTLENRFFMVVMLKSAVLKRIFFDDCINYVVLLSTSKACLEIKQAY